MGARKNLNDYFDDGTKKTRQLKGAAYRKKADRERDEWCGYESGTSDFSPDPRPSGSGERATRLAAKGNQTNE